MFWESFLRMTSKVFFLRNSFTLCIRELIKPRGSQLGWYGLSDRKTVENNKTQLVLEETYLVPWI